MGTCEGDIEKSGAERHFPDFLGYESDQFLKEKAFEESNILKILPAASYQR